ncbi:hypothetical protein E2C01_065393 [Portunus trituberculatus]|uniref:Uncharacterized protein n=1 Tax=Portunus trituberculatus TaxID=210409 RepID=A0A5B7HRL2_PORTR|nr:hypothetical protein [Portunus trituberculatus]
MPRCSSSSPASKRPSSKKVLPMGEDKRKRDRQKDNGAKQQVVCASLSSVVGLSHDASTPLISADHSARDIQLDRLSMVISGLLAKLDGNPPTTIASVGSGADFSGITAAFSGDKNGEILEGVSDPLEELDSFGVPQPANPDTGGDNADFLCALEELSGHFQGEKEKGEPHSEHLATILNVSLRCRLCSDGMKSTCSTIKFSSNVPNLSVPATNSAVTSAMTVGGKLIDVQLFHTNGLSSKSLVPVAQCNNDIGERKGKPVSNLEGLHNSLRLLTSAVNYVNQLWKEVVQIHINDLTLTELCKWEYAVGREELFLFDVTNKCDEISKTRKLRRPSFHPHRMSGSR